MGLEVPRRKYDWRRKRIEKEAIQR